MNLWPWRKTGGDIPQADRECPQSKAARELEARFAVGDRFFYLGRELIVSQVGKWSFWPTVGSAFYSTVTCEYADDHGVIHEQEFGCQQLSLLLACKRNL